MAEVEAGSKNLGRLSECNIQFQMMRFEPLSHSYFSNEITCGAVQLVADCIIWTKTVLVGELFKGDKVLRSV